MAGVLEKKAATRLNTVIVGYFVAVVAAASAGLTLFLVHGVVMIHEIGHDVSPAPLKIGFLAAIFFFACLVTFAGGLLPFAAMLWKAERSKARGPRLYAFVCGAGCLVEFLLVVVPASIGNVFFTAQSALLGALWFAFSGAAGGLAYWFYARGRPPMSNWTD
ncbi:MAG: hypothetical protein WB816_06385 [Methylocystis sp.]